MNSYTTVTGKGQITLPVKMRRFLSLEPGKKVKLVMKAGGIFISKPENIEDVRSLLHAEMAKKRTGGKSARSGDGWTAHVKEKYHGKP